MNKYILSALLIAITLVTACKNDKVDTSDSDNIIAENGVAKDSTFELFIRSFNEIQDNLDSIKAVENIIATKTQNRDVRDVKQDIQEDILAIKSFMVINKKKMEGLNEMLNKDDKNMRESERLMLDMQKLYDRTNNELEVRSLELQDMGNYVNSLKLKLGSVTDQLQREKLENEKKTNELNTAYLVIGTSKDLIRDKIISKAGLLGLSKNAKLSSDFNKSKFKKINIQEQRHIAIKAKSAKIVTIHPSKSYKITRTEKYVDALEIKNPTEFWGTSKYLVVVIEN